jgi:two-component system chemotaxis response regulator CheY
MTSLLIVDDSATLRKMIIAVLRPLQLNCEEASNGLEAIEQLAVRRYDGITLDLYMPDMHGLEFLNFIRKHRAFKDLPVVVITTQTDEGMRQRALAAGANFYITKPFQPEEVLSTVRQIFQPGSLHAGN